MSSEMTYREAVRMAQGSTFLWTEHYADRTASARLLETARDAAFGLALVVMAAGVAGFLTLETPVARSAATVVAHWAL
jgi:hypothetical protein